jgi:DNA polymerase III sliding clamp (beta) subunit (PCNA family)
MNDPFTLLPANLGGLTRVTTRESLRYALAGVRVQVRGGDYEVAATDGRRLAIVRGKMAGDPLAYPACPELADLPPAEEAATIPAKEWQEAFREAGQARPGEPGTGCVALHLGPTESVLATTDGDEVQARRVSNVEGRYPDYHAVLPRKEPAARVDVNAAYLLDLVRLAKEFSLEEKGHRITLEIHAANEPMVLQATNGTQELVALLMPMTDPPGAG